MKADRPPAADDDTGADLPVIPRNIADWIDRLLTAPLADVRTLAMVGWL